MDSELNKTALADILLKALQHRLNERNRLAINVLLRERVSTAQYRQLREALEQHIYRIDS